MTDEKEGKNVLLVIYLRTSGNPSRQPGGTKPLLDCSFCVSALRVQETSEVCPRNANQTTIPSFSASLPSIVFSTWCSFIFCRLSEQAASETINFHDDILVLFRPVLGTSKMNIFLGTYT